MSEKTEALTLELGNDHLLDLTKLKKPILALEELIWNALDADATHVKIIFVKNLLQGFKEIIVEDNGHGIDANNKKDTFGKLGDSLKKQTLYTRTRRRTMHGKEGKGRFRALGLGNRVEWFSRYLDLAKGLQQWTISADSAELRKFRFSKPTASDLVSPGCTVTISNLNDSLISQLLQQDAIDELTARLALYLKKHQDITIQYDIKILNPSKLQISEKNYPVVSTLPDGSSITAEMTVIEWTRNLERKLYTCNSKGFPVSEFQPSIQAPGYHFTAYLKTHLLDEVTDTSADIVELLPGMSSLLDSSRQTLKDHFRTREIEKRHSIIERWKNEGIYPYSASVSGPLDKMEREVFDICALNIHDHLPKFEDSEFDARKLTLRLLKQALETSPSSLQEILKEVLALPADRQKDLAELLKRTKFENIITASKLIMDRLAFLGSLRTILFEREYRQQLLERTQLQNILINELWVFGEQYTLGHNDEALRSLLTSHMKILGRPVMNEEVNDINGNPDQRPDLMLYRRYPQRTQGEYEHLVIELKRPSVLLGMEEITQIKKYAFTVADDARFDKGKTKWTFLLIGGKLDRYGEQESQQVGRAKGLIDVKPHMEIWVKPWASVLTDCEWQYDVYRKALEYEATKEDSTEYLQEKHAKYLPDLNQPATPKKKKGNDKKAKKAGSADSVPPADEAPPRDSEPAEGPV